MKSKIGLLLVISLTGCAAGSQWTWYKSNSSEAELNSTKYSCLQKAQQPYSSSSAYNSGGIVSSQSITTQSSSAGISTNNELFEACMTASGFVKQYIQNPNSIRASSIKMSVQEAKNSCILLGFKSGTYPYDECVKTRSSDK